MANTAASEAVLWADLSNSITADLMLATVIGAEHRNRTEIILESANAMAALASKLAASMSRVASRANDDANAAANEALLWLDVANAASAKAKTAAANVPSHQASPAKSEGSTGESTVPRADVDDMILAHQEELSNEIQRRETVILQLTREREDADHNIRELQFKIEELEHRVKSQQASQAASPNAGLTDEDTSAVEAARRQIEEQRRQLELEREEILAKRDEADAQTQRAAEAVRTAQRVEQQTQARRTELEEMELQVRSVMRDQDSEASEKRHQIEEMEQETTKLKSHIQTLRMEAAEVDKALESRRAGSLEERQQLERELQELRDDVRKEKLNLQTLKVESDDARMEATTASETHRSRAAPPRYGSDNERVVDDVVVGEGETPVRGASSPDRYNGMPHTASSGEYHSDSQRQPQVTPSLATGLAALQNVREQLREMRENSQSPVRTRDPVQFQTTTTAYSSPPRTQSSGGIDTNPYQSPSSANVLRRANTTSFSPSPSSGSGAYGSSVASRSAADLRPSQSMMSPSQGAGGPGVSPWKARLVKLQGELKSLRTELGTA